MPITGMAVLRDRVMNDKYSLKTSRYQREGRNTSLPSRESENHLPGLQILAAGIPVSEG